MTSPTTPPSEDPLDSLLRRGRAEIADDGFTERVLAALPETATPLAQPAKVWDARAAILLVAALAACAAIGFVIMPLASRLVPAALDVTSAVTVLFIGVAGAAVGGAFGALVEAET